MTEFVTLPARLDTAAADMLSASLTPHVGTDLSLDASAVEHLGARCLEVLLRLRHASGRAGRTLRLTAPSPTFIADLATFGLSEDDIETGVSS